MTYNSEELFEWDVFKAHGNSKKHNVTFYEAVTVWIDQNSIDLLDSLHSQFEERWIRLGMSQKSNLLVVIYTERNEGKKIRIISARKASNKESHIYYLKKV